MPHFDKVKASVREEFKATLTRVGAALPARLIQDLRISMNYVALGAWMKTHGFDTPARLPDRFRVFDRIAQRVGEPLLYLEFGVFRGESIRYWSDMLRHVDSRLFGFDSFEGLPESFDERLGYNLGTFDTGGDIPSVDDPRVSFEKGSFEDTLSRFHVPEHRALVITLDADLYSSTITVLRALKDHIVPGIVIYFDDFSQLEHEPRALADFVSETGIAFRLLCSDRSLNRPAFLCV